MVERNQPKKFAKEQMEAESAKYGQQVVDEQVSRAINLPLNYGKTRIIAMVRDPWWIFAYWEITPELESSVKEQIKKNGQNFEKSVIRIHDITGIKKFDGKNSVRFFDITLRDFARNWYVDVSSPSRRWCIEIGMVTKEGNFYLLARSNIIQTPRFGMSDMLDEEWMLSEEEYCWLFGVSGGFGIGKSSLEMKELFKKYLQEWITSGGVSSLGSHILQQKK